jgi:hypothetical protein
MDMDRQADEAWILNVQRKLYHISGVRKILATSGEICGAG